MSLVNVLDGMISAFSMQFKKPLASFSSLETADDEHTLVGSDGSLMTLLRVDGTRRVMGQAELEALVEAETRSMSPFLDKAGHAVQVWFARDPDLSGDVLKALTLPARNVARHLGLELDDLFAERERNLAQFIVWESFHMALWTRPTVLTKAERSQARIDNKPPKLWPTAGDAQNLFAAVRQLRDRHASFVAAFKADLGRVGIRADRVEAHEALKAVKGSVYPNMVGANWRPWLPGDPIPTRMPEIPGDFSHLFMPRIDEQLFDRDGKSVGTRIATVGNYSFAGLDMAIGPQDVTPFSALIQRMTESAEFPWRASFLIEGDGLGGFGLKAALAGIMSVTSAENRQIRDAIKALKEMQRQNGGLSVRLRVSFATWAPAGDLRRIEERASKLQRAVESWGYCKVSPTAGDPLAAVMSSALAVDCASTAPAGAPPLSDVVYMLPWNRDASPWRSGAVLFRTHDGRPWPYQPGSSLQSTWIDLLLSGPGGGKSVMLNTTSLALCLSTAATAGSGGAKLPRIAIIDIGPSSSGLISLLKEALPAARRHEVEYKRLRMMREHAINPFDTQLGCRRPFPLERGFLVNFLTLLGTPVGESKPPTGLSDLAGMAVDEVYAMLDDTNRKGQPRPYAAGEDEVVDEAIRRRGCRLPQAPTWWGVVDALFAAEERHAAMRAQRFAVPRVEDVSVVIRSAQVADVFGNARTSTGEQLVDVLQRTISTALREFPILTQPTRFDIGDARVCALDLDEVAPGGGGATMEKQTSLVYMLARFVLAKDFYLNEEIVGLIPESYRTWHAARIRRIRETPKRIVFDEFHRTAASPSVRQQVMVDMREGRKWGVHVTLASQLLSDFDKDMVDIATGVWILGAGDRATEEMKAVFALSDTAVEIVRRNLHGPGPKGAPFLAVLALKDGKHEHLLYNTLGPTELWAFSTTAEDVALRNRLYAKLGAVEARRRLGRRFPGGSAKAEMERRITRLQESGQYDDDSADGVIDAIAREVVEEASA